MAPSLPAAFLCREEWLDRTDRKSFHHSGGQAGFMGHRGGVSEDVLVDRLHVSCFRDSTLGNPLQGMFKRVKAEYVLRSEI